MSTTKLSIWIISIATLGGLLRGAADTLWPDTLLYALIDVGGWVALVMFAASASHTLGYRQAKDTYKGKLDALTAILPGHGPAWDAWLKGKKVGAKSMRSRAYEVTYSADSVEEACEGIRGLRLIYDSEWAEATKEDQ